jgi:hypothetical protein
VWRVGFLGDGSLTERAAISLEPLPAGLRELGHVEGGNVVVHDRWSEGKSERLLDLARDLVDAKVDVIVTHGVRGTKAALGLTIPSAVLERADEIIE